MLTSSLLYILFQTSIKYEFTYLNLCVLRFSQSQWILGRHGKRSTVIKKKDPWVDGEWERCHSESDSSIKVCYFFPYVYEDILTHNCNVSLS